MTFSLIANFLPHSSFFLFLSEIFALDNDVISHSPKVYHDPAVDMITTGSLSLSHGSHFLYMQGLDTIAAAKKMVKVITNSIGLKRSAILIDTCVADLFDSLSKKIVDNRSLCDETHSNWLNKQQGLVVIAIEVSTIASLHVLFETLSTSKTHLMWVFLLTNSLLLKPLLLRFFML